MAFAPSSLILANNFLPLNEALCALTKKPKNSLVLVCFAKQCFRLSLNKLCAFANKFAANLLSYSTLGLYGSRVILIKGSFVTVWVKFIAWFAHNKLLKRTKYSLLGSYLANFSKLYFAP